MDGQTDGWCATKSRMHYDEGVEKRHRLLQLMRTRGGGGGFVRWQMHVQRVILIIRRPTCHFLPSGNVTDKKKTASSLFKQVDATTTVLVADGEIKTSAEWQGGIASDQRGDLSGFPSFNLNSEGYCKLQLMDGWRRYNWTSEISPRSVASISNWRWCDGWWVTG